MELCIKCKGRGFCGGPCEILQLLKKFQPKIKLDFSGTSPPEVFVGHHNYPKVFMGVLAPAEHLDSSSFSMPEIWYRERKSILEILANRSRMIYSRFLSRTRGNEEKKLKEKIQEVALSSKPVDISVQLKKKPNVSIELDKHVAIIGNPAPIKNLTLEENVETERKIDYIVDDIHVNASEAILELYESGITISHIIKLFTAGLLGVKSQRKFVPTRWAVTAVDSIISEGLLNKIRFYPQLQEYRVFHSNYLGNYYTILLIPRCWSFEVVEISERGYFGKGKLAVWKDFEPFEGRKTYAESVTGAYYANRLAVAEYLERIKRQASCIVFREIREEYWAPCGVGILRECCRGALNNNPSIFYSLEDALEFIRSKMKIPLKFFLEESKLIKEIKEQKKIDEF